MNSLHTGVVMSHEPCQPPVTTSPSTAGGESPKPVDPTTSKAKITAAGAMSPGTSKFAADLLMTPRSQTSSTPRQPPELPRPRREEQVEVPPVSDSELRIRRRLFCDDSPVESQNEANSRFLAEEFEKIHKQQLEKYNFDFKNEAPLSEKPGQWYKWSSPGQGSSSSSSVLTARPYQQAIARPKPTPIRKPVIEPSETTTKTTMIITMGSSSSGGSASQVTAASSSTSSRHPSTLMDHMPVVSKPRTSCSRMSTSSGSRSSGGGVGGMKRMHDWLEQQQQPITSAVVKEDQQQQQQQQQHEGEQYDVTSTSVANKRARMSSSSQQPPTKQQQQRQQVSSSSSEDDS